MSGDAGDRRRRIIVSSAVVAVAFVFGVIIGYFGNTGGSSSASALAESLSDKPEIDQQLLQHAIQEVDNDNLRNNLKVLTQAPHIAGQERDKELTQWIKKRWLGYGFDKVDLAEYDFYLSWPNKTNPNKIHLLDEDGQIQFTSAHKERELREGDDHPNFVHAFNAYATAGTVEGQLVYVNYGRVEDLREAEKILGEDFLKGKICISRYGKIFRGNKVHNCQNKGAVGVILFSDPADVAVEGTDPANVYPHTFFLPGSGIQRGSTYIGDGDPLSPTWASVPHAHRLSPDKIDGLPKIPAQPIGYDDAQVLMEKLGGKDPPSDAWKGKLKADYKLGGAFRHPWKDWKVRLKVNNYAGTVKSSNVIGYIKGDVEPDRYVMLSNHRDAWGYGAADPSSGTAQMMEVARVLGRMKKTGWRPRRTLVFCNWASEEYGLEGSYEWVYEHLIKLQHRTVGLVNTDTCVSGPIAKPQASPQLREVLVKALSSASDPTSDVPRSYYEFWKEWTNLENDGPPKLPKIGTLGSGTDHAAFAFYAGIPAINIKFRPDSKKHKGVLGYPTYHTGYETFYLMDEIIDPGFKIHRVCAQTSLHVLLQLAESALLPYDVNSLPAALKETLVNFDKTNVTKTLTDNGVTLQHLEEAVDAFASAAKRFTGSMSVDDDWKSNPMRLRMLNDQIMQLERVFVMDGGLPDRGDVRNAAFAPGKFNKYGGGGFPAIPDLLHEIDKLSVGSTDYTNRWDAIKQHISDLMIMVQSAARFLAPLDNI